jgi:hypothetical protein
MMPQTAKELVRQKYLRNMEKAQQKAVSDGFGNLFENLAEYTRISAEYYRDLEKINKPIEATDESKR